MLKLIMFNHAKIVFRFLIIVVILLVSLMSRSQLVHADDAVTPTPKKLYLPLVQNGSSLTAGFSTANKFIGIYMQQYWTANSVGTYMTQADNLAQKKHTVSGWFIAMQNIAFTSRQTDVRVNNFYSQLEALWGRGYISFVNIQSASSTTAYEVTDNCVIPFSAYQIAKGDCDRAIQRMADLYKQWVSQGGGRKAFIAPFPEMNGVYTDGSKWTSYGGDAPNYKLAYKRIMDIFIQRGVARSQAWWVFAPNGWSTSGHEFENYYPGNSTVDVIGFSSYNYGFCHIAIPWQRWENYDTIYTPYLDRISNMAPNKPVILAQTGTTAEFQRTGVADTNAKNNWLKTNYDYLSRQPHVLGILYYDFDLAPQECNWEVNSGSSSSYTGYRDGAANSVYRYFSIGDLNNTIP